MEDDNILGITAPTTTAWVSWECVRDELDSLIGQQPVPKVRLGHVEGPHGSGKSTGMLEYISHQIRIVSPETTVIYVPSFDHEAALLHVYFQSTSSTHTRLKGNTRVGFDGGIESKLCLTTIARLRQDILHSTLPERVALLLDLQRAPTADGELLLSELAHWCRGLLSDADSSGRELTLITMATFSRPPIHKLLADHLQTRCQHIIMTKSGVSHVPGPSTSLSSEDLPLRTACATIEGDIFRNIMKELVDAYLVGEFDRNRHKRSNLEVENELKTVREDNVLETMVETLDMVEIRGRKLQGDKAKGFSVVVFMDIEDDGLMLILEDTCFDLDIALFRIDEDSNLAQIFEILVHLGPKIVCIHPGSPFALYIPRIAAIVYYGAACCRTVFDTSIGQFSTMQVSWSRMDLLTAQSYALKSAGSDGMRKTFYCLGDDLDDIEFDDHFDYRKLTPYAPAYESEVMRLSFELCAPWPDQGIDHDDKCLVPLPAMSDARLLKEMWRRLVNMGCLRYLPDRRLRPMLNGPRARRTLRHLNHTLDREPNPVPLAYFMAGIEDAGSNPTKRVMARIAALIKAGRAIISYAGPVRDLMDNMLRIEDDPKREAELKKEIRAHLVAVCRGVGAREFRRGDVWKTLGLFLGREEQDSRGQVLDGANGTQIAPAYFEHALNVTRKLENMVGLDASEDPIRDTDLQPYELDAVNKQLMLSWLHHTVVFHPGAEKAPVDLTTYQSLELLSAYEQFDGLDGIIKDHVFAFSHVVIQKNDRSSIGAVTEIPARLVQSLMRERGPLFLENQYPLTKQS
ncbi:hypothetical protein F4820DRAFT_450298 [Hypoxylon rubiginosum]|uniref:Uncharacterized protein n=1 Tax=Hypoxylon rubiginosum TaxID=110542 RepID=A0ACB9YUX2_9PEZI|nr:hypothetical protein F4820DRAFT_450298 [Hypoxylon rubiginosum]